MRDDEDPDTVATDDRDAGALTELDHDECVRRLASTLVGRVAVLVEGLIVVVPVNHRLVVAGGKTWIAFRTKPGGVLDRPGEQAAFEVDAGHAVRHTGWSVLVQGILQRVDPDAAGFRARFDPVPWTRDDRDRWMVLEPFSISGRRIASAW
jgi:hypothetical protein